MSAPLVEALREVREDMLSMIRKRDAAIEKLREQLRKANEEIGRLRWELEKR